MLFKREKVTLLDLDFQFSDRICRFKKVAEVNNLTCVKSKP